MTIREQIVANVKTAFETILVSGGYNLDLGNNINTYKTTIFEKDSLPGVNIMHLESVKEEEGPIGKFRRAMQIEVEIFLASGTNTVNDAWNAISDVEKCVGLNYKWGGLAVYTKQPDKEEIVPSQENNIISGAKIVFSIIYDAPKWEQ